MEAGAAEIKIWMGLVCDRGMTEKKAGHHIYPGYGRSTRQLD
jgi:hypothetical protein